MVQPKIKNNLQVPNYAGAQWNGSLDLTADIEEFKAITMETESEEQDGGHAHINNNNNNNQRQLSVSVHTVYTHSMDLYIYSSYWIINKTALPLQIRVSILGTVYILWAINNTGLPHPFLGSVQCRQFFICNLQCNILVLWCRH